MFALALFRHCLIAAAFLNLDAPSNPQSFDLTISVVGADHQPIAKAVVEVVDATTTRIVGTTNGGGAVTVRASRGQRFRARVGNAVSTVESAQEPTLRLVIGLPSIGHVAARIAHSEARTTAASARALISGDVAGALGYLPNVRSAAEGGTGRQSLNGVPLDLPAPPGSASAGGGIPTDLVASFDAVQADDGSYPDYHLLAPTPVFSASLTAGAAAFAGSRWKATVAGPQGAVHYALAVATSRDDGILTGRQFADQSGVRYDHGAHAQHVDVSLTGNATIGTVNLAFVGFESERTAAFIDADQPGKIVQGLGPGNRVDGTSGLEFVLATWSRGRDEYSVIDGRYAGGETFDFTHALIDAVPAPSISGYRYAGGFDDVSWTRRFGGSSLTFKLSANENVSDGFSGASSTEVASNGVRTSARTLGAAYGIGHDDANAGASLTARGGSGPFAGEVLEAAAFAAKRIAGIDARVSLSEGQSQSDEASYATASTLDPPQKATIVCGPATAVVNGPAQVDSTHPRSRTLALSLARVAENATIRVGAFRSDVTNALVQVDVGGAVLPSGYSGALETFFRSLCPGQTLAAADTYVQRYQSVSVLRQAEWYADITRQLGSISLEAFYETFADAPARTGDQLPQVPLHRAAATVAFSRGAFTGAIGARFIATNNDMHLPGHIVADAGLRVRARSGTVEASVQNLFGSYAGLFNSPRFAVPLPTSGAPIPTLATPLPRTWTLRYVVGIGPRS